MVQWPLGSGRPRSSAPNAVVRPGARPRPTCARPGRNRRASDTLTLRRPALPRAVPDGKRPAARGGYELSRRPL